VGGLRAPVAMDDAAALVEVALLFDRAAASGDRGSLIADVAAVMRARGWASWGDVQAVDVDGVVGAAAGRYDEALRAVDSGACVAAESAVTVSAAMGMTRRCVTLRDATSEVGAQETTLSGECAVKPDGWEEGGGGRMRPQLSLTAPMSRRGRVAGRVWAVAIAIDGSGVVHAAPRLTAVTEARGWSGWLPLAPRVRRRGAGDHAQ